jgi:hypothetical protein
VRILNGPLRPDCARSTDRVLSEIAADAKLKLVVLAARWPLYRDQPPFYDENSPRVVMADAGQPRARGILAGPLARTLDAIHLRNPQAQVVVVGPVPELTLIPPQCVAQARRLGQREAFCWTVPAGPPLARANPAQIEIMHALAGRSWAHGAFPSLALCDGERCAAAAADGRLLYFDDDHLSASGARRLVPGWLDRALSTPGA